MPVLYLLLGEYAAPDGLPGCGRFSEVRTGSCCLKIGWRPRAPSTASSRITPPARELVLKTRNEQLDLLPSDLEIETLLAGAVDGFFRLGEGLDTLEGYDYIVMDCPPNLGLTVFGALLTMFNARTAISQAILSSIEEHVLLFESRISRAVAIDETHLMKQSILEYSGKAKVAEENEKFTLEVLGRMNGSGAAGYGRLGAAVSWLGSWPPVASRTGRCAPTATIASALGVSFP